MNARPEPTDHPDKTGFGSTRWSLVLAAGNAAEPGSKEALARLCQDYWYPLYAYVRRRVPDVHEAQDLVQEFFTRLLEKNLVSAADPQRGRFRAFLLTSLRNFLANEWARDRRSRRAAVARPLSIDLEAGETRFLRELADHLTPEKLFDRRWAETLLDRVTLGLQDEYARTGRQAQFQELKPFLAGKNDTISYADAARRLGVSEGSALVAAHRLRRRFRELLFAEILQTLANPDELDDEINRLFAALAP